MTRTEQLELIHQKCIATNPEIGTENCLCCGKKECDYSTTGCSWYRGRPIRLADILLAIAHCEKNWNEENWGLIAAEIYENHAEAEFESNEHGHAFWKLRADDLIQQSDECITFLADLLK